jgi:hypothetical protein
MSAAVSDRSPPQHDRKRAAVMEVEDRRVLLIDQHREHRHAPAAEQRGRDIGADRQGEDDDGAGQQAGKAERPDDRAETLGRAGAQIRRRLLEPAVDRGDGIAGRQHDEGQQNIDEPDDDAGFGAEEPDRPLDQPRALERLVDDADTTEQHHPAEGTHDVAGEERDHQKDDTGAPQPARLDDTHEVVGERIAEHHGDRRGHERDAQREPQYVPMIGVQQHAGVMRKRQAAAVGGGRAGHQDDGERKREEGGKEQQRRRQKRPGHVAPQCAEERGQSSHPACSGRT